MIDMEHEVKDTPGDPLFGTNGLRSMTSILVATTTSSHRKEIGDRGCERISSILIRNKEKDSKLQQRTEGWPWHGMIDIELGVKDAPGALCFEIHNLGDYAAGTCHRT